MSEIMAFDRKKGKELKEEVLNKLNDLNVC